MRLTLSYADGRVSIAADDDKFGLVASGEGEKLEDAAKALISRFAEMQHEAIQALVASGLVRTVTKEELAS